MRLKKKVKILSSGTDAYLEKSVNNFLNTLDQASVLDIKFNVCSENQNTETNYSAMIIYLESPEIHVNDLPGFYEFDHEDSIWTELIIQPVRSYEKGEERIVEVVAANEAEFWSLYATHSDGTKRCIADVSTRVEAEMLKTMIYSLIQ
jgi:hypothetical protein